MKVHGKKDVEMDSRYAGGEHKGLGFTGLSFPVLIPLHQKLGPGRIVAYVNPAWDACIFFVFGCQKTPSPKALKVRGVFHATTHDPVLGDNATTDSTGH